MADGCEVVEGFRGGLVGRVCGGGEVCREGEEMGARGRKRGCWG